ncbi:MAG: type II toxin-antitoxin system VapC family toxin, partial [Terriglobia bacterium]
MAETPYLVDSNVLLRWVKPGHSDYSTIVSATDAILRHDGILCYTSQNVGEFWNACTRPVDRNGYGLSP